MINVSQKVTLRTSDSVARSLLKLYFVLQKTERRIIKPLNSVFDFSDRGDADGIGLFTHTYSVVLNAYFSYYHIFIRYLKCCEMCAVVYLYVYRRWSGKRRRRRRAKKTQAQMLHSRKFSIHTLHKHTYLVIHLLPYQAKLYSIFFFVSSPI